MGLTYLLNYCKDNTKNSTLGGGLALLNVVTGQSRTIVPSRAMNSPARVFRFWLSADLNYVLLATRPQKLFRHSFM